MKTSFTLQTFGLCCLLLDALCSTDVQMDGRAAMSFPALDTLLGVALWVQSYCSCLQSTLMLTEKPSSSSCVSTGVISCPSHSRHMPDSWRHLFHPHSSLVKYSPVSSLDRFVNSGAVLSCKSYPWSYSIPQTFVTMIPNSPQSRFSQQDFPNLPR